MKNEALYNKTVDILVQAYFNDTLQLGNPCGCAVGNLVAAANCYKYKELEMGIIEYGHGIWPSWYNLINENYTQGDDREGERQISSTGYTLDEIFWIERSFEFSGRFDGDTMFNGLMAVIEVLDIIHENTDTAITIKSKSLFQKA